MSLPIHRFEAQARTVLLESRRLAERRKDAWITPHHLLWVLLSHSASPPANLTPGLTAQSLESELDHTPAPERQLKFACVDPSLKQLLLNLIKATQAQATPPGVSELWDALGEAGILEDYQVAAPVLFRSPARAQPQPRCFHRVQGFRRFKPVFRCWQNSKGRPLQTVFPCVDVTKRCCAVCVC